MEYLFQKTKTANDYAADSRKNLEIMQREVNKLNALLAEERDKNHEIITQLNQAHEERREYHSYLYENDLLKKEMASLKAELTVSRH